jgi:VWFA-related protein
MGLGAMVAVRFLCPERARAQTAVSTATPFVNPQGTASGTVAWPQVRMDVRFLPKQGDEVFEVGPDDIHLFDNKVEVKGASIARDRTPLSICLVVDESGSLFDHAQLQVAAARAAIAAMQPGDEMAIVVFNNRGMLKQDFTSDPKELERPLENLTFWGPSDLFDTVIATMDHLFKHSQYMSRILLILSDGGNNQSGSDLRQTTDQLSATNGPTVYSMSMESQAEEKSEFQNLRAIAKATGGDAIKIKPNVTNVNGAILALMHEARDRYTVVYTPVQQQRDGSLHKVKLKVGKLSGYSTEVRAVARGEYHAPAK